MEFGIRPASLENVNKSPGELLDTEFCDTDFLELCPDAPVTALYFGSEFCQELLPSIQEAAAFCAGCADHGLEAVLLTPPVTQKGLARVGRLLAGLAEQGYSPAVVCNDWGVLGSLHKTHPSVALRMGRLMNRGLRDPRLDMPAPRPAGENTDRGAGIRKLALSLGVGAVETDADLQPGYLGPGGSGLERTLHLPFTFATSGRNCLEKAAAASAGKGLFTHGLKSGCTAPCRDTCRREYRQDTGKPMWRAGNTLFFEAPRDWIARHIVFADRVVLHERPLP